MPSSFTAHVSLATILLLGVAGPACATANRAWVSGHGVDQAGCGAPTAPCRSLQYTHDHVIAAGGEIDILDPAGYGAVTITKSVSIVNDGVGTAGVQATSGDAITINAGPSDVVSLRGLNIDGVNQAASDGVLLNSGASLAVQNCVVQHFGGSGINVHVATGTATVSIINSISSENGSFGVLANAGGSANISLVIDHFIAQRDLTGVAVFATGSTQYAVTLTNSLLANNAGEGVAIGADTGAVLGVVDNVIASQNADNGLANSLGGVVHVSRSVLSQNGDGINTTATPTPTFGVFSAGDNLIVGNSGVGVSGVLQTDTLR